MTLELPVFRLGLAGFSAQQEADLAATLSGAAPGAMIWEPGRMAEADAWWVNGSRVERLGNDTLRIAATSPGGRPLQLRLPEVDRPIAFSVPLACSDLQPAYSFDAASRRSMNAVLEKFEAWLSPVSAQFCLASHIVEHEIALGSGTFEVHLNSNLLAIVNIPGEIAVLPSAGPADFEDAVWSRRRRGANIPENFVRTSLSQLMWQYAVRTQRDVLPRHYRTGLLYYRRPPRLPQRVVLDSHLLLMRELACAPASFETLQGRCGLDPDQLARDLAALYFVGSITSNPKRAAINQRPLRQEDLDSAYGTRSSLPSVLDSVLPAMTRHRIPAFSDMTAPAALRPN
jgi:hypothetical protein